MWRDTGRPVKVVFLDARACLPVLVFVVYWSWTTFYIAATGVLFLTSYSIKSEWMSNNCIVSP